MTASDQQVSPEARLAAVQGQLHADVCGAEHLSPVQDQWWCKQIAERLLALPTLAADLALAADINRISRWGMDGWVIECDSQDSTAYRVTVTGYDPKRSRLHPTLHEAIEEALSDE